MIDSVVLCGGHGTRLYPETLNAPKALVQVGRRPVLDWILGHLIDEGSRHIILCAGFRFEDIRDHIRALSISPPVEDAGALVCEVASPDGARAELVVCDTGVGTPTGARLHRVERYLRGDVLVTYSDVLADVSLTGLMSSHRGSGASATLTVTRVTSPFGHVEVSRDGRVSTFIEKPLLRRPVNIGFMVLSDDARSHLSNDSPQLEEDLLPVLAADGRLAAYSHEGHFQPMDTVADQQRLNRMWRSGDLDWLQEPMASPTR